MFLCHFPSGCPAWELPSALPVRSSDLPLAIGERSPGLLKPNKCNIPLAIGRRRVQIRNPPAARTQHLSDGVRQRVESEVGKLVGALVPLPRDVLQRERVKAATQFQNALEVRTQTLIANAVAEL